MAEDSGAFKTNPANSRQIPAIRDNRACTVAAKPHRPKKRFQDARRHSRRQFSSKLRKPLR
jgi:hypothetical protein